MRKLIPTLLLFLSFTVAKAQKSDRIRLNHTYDSIAIQGEDSLVLQLNFKKGNTYQILVRQLGIDVTLALFDQIGNKILDKDSPNGSNGFEIFEYQAMKSEPYQLVIQRLEEEENEESGWISVYIKHFTPKELTRKKQVIQELAIENQKNLLTIDVDHFWEAYDHLKDCKTLSDSILCFQYLYFDRGTNGLKDLISLMSWSPEWFVNAVRRLSNYFETVRPYTYQAKDSAQFIEEVYRKFESIYSNLKPFKVCFVIGFQGPAGIVLNRTILIDAVLLMGGKYTELAESQGFWELDASLKGKDLSFSLQSTVVRECIRIQQPKTLDSNVVVCDLLRNSLSEGAGNFIEELIFGKVNDAEIYQYGDTHEAVLWSEFKATMCSSSYGNWLYNWDSPNYRPANLGIYFGYKICQAYYNRAPDKQQAIKDIIEIKDPLSILQISGYDEQEKK